MDSGTLIAGRVRLDDVMAELARQRPVFHSEADLQHGFARALWELGPGIHARLEVPQHVTAAGQRLDLLCLGESGETAVEFKYHTRTWSGTPARGPRAEPYLLAQHGADDLARLGFVTDLARLEGFCTGPGRNGLALILTNEPRLWQEPKPAKKTRDQDFRIHQGRTLAGELLWAEGTYVPNTRTLLGSYPLRWRPYSGAADGVCEFRYLAAEVAAGPGATLRAWQS